MRTFREPREPTTVVGKHMVYKYRKARAAARRTERALRWDARNGKATLMAPASPTRAREAWADKPEDAHLPPHMRRKVQDE